MRNKAFQKLSEKGKHWKHITSCIDNVWSVGDSQFQVNQLTSWWITIYTQTYLTSSVDDLCVVDSNIHQNKMRLHQWTFHKLLMIKNNGTSLTDCRMIGIKYVWFEILGTWIELTSYLLSDHTQAVLTSYIDVVRVVDSKFHQTKWSISNEPFHKLLIHIQYWN